MATPLEVMQIIIGPISVLYSAEIDANVETQRYSLMVEEYVRFLEPYDADDLKRAMDYIRKTYKQRAWPKPAHFYGAIAMTGRSVLANKAHWVLLDDQDPMHGIGV